ncbi:MAG: hypothetical protein HQL66_07145 [Magnetococcales bacterium]|nr:hypothetical protein [Magnetococcales bacterium]
MTSLELIGALLLVAAVVHTFLVGFFRRLACARTGWWAGVWRLFGETELVFVFWAGVLLLIMLGVEGVAATVVYVADCRFAEVLFLFIIMVLAGTRPILRVALAGVVVLARAMPVSGGVGAYVVILVVLPLLGSLITEPAAMTLAASLLARHFFVHGISTRLRYATLGTLLVNVSIGGTLTPFAAPPIIMVAGPWGWDTGFMVSMLGWKAALASVVNTVGVVLLFRRELSSLPVLLTGGQLVVMPPLLILLHLFLLGGVVIFAHQPVVLVGLFLVFLVVARVYRRHHDRLIVREALFVGLFLAGLVILGGEQRWWLQSVLTGVGREALFWGATALTAVIDNAALTYLGSLIVDLPEAHRYALVAGAVTGGGLTVIANAPNPAGIALLRPYFADAVVHPFGLFLAALVPTLIAAWALIGL